ncbi:BLUF domain-containing protein [Spongiibacter sp. KMU-158]|uniref:BLUF domain-containing protein n=1 Tax=Spongiibacter pelagi TaxID=2760804 RepID=A0A927C2D3_9GAMM|nr:BLUF domain-containing protein [Spongiibacter pelagi]MBD2858371.1 BLUF domain-containing protein [Spongiibacter pelagi]
MSEASSNNKLVRCIFVSAAPRAVQESAIPQFLFDFRRASAEHQLTGMMLCEGRDFFQVVEGRREQIDELYKQVELDKRQHRLLKILDEDLESRDFKDMSLAYGIAGRRVFRKLDDNGEVFSKQGPVHRLPDTKTKTLMLQFAQKRWRRAESE